MEAALSNPEKIKIPVFKNRNFLFLLISALFSAPGYYVYLIGAEWLMLSISDNRFFFGMLFFAAAIPRLLLLTTGGLIADRFNKRTILFLSDISRVILIVILLGFIWSDSITAWYLLILAALFGISDAFSYPALNSMTPMLLEEEQLQRGNSFMQMTTQVSPILGPALGGTFIALLGFKGVFLIAAIMLLIASIAVLFIRLKEEKNEVEKPSPWSDLKEGLAYARKNELVVSVVIMAFFLNFFFSGPLAIGLPIMVKDIFQSDAVGLATVQTSMGIGALIGAIILATITLKKPGVTVIVGLITLGVLYTITGLSYHLYVTAGLVAAMTLTTQFVNIPLITVLQQSTEKKMLGRMMSFFMTVSTGLVPVSFVVTSILIAVGVSIQTIIVCSGMVITLISIYMFRNKKLLRFTLSKEGVSR
ncbi:MFS transporter [Ornithinibacillus halophilus]|uniref:Major Facilitator Superfamily protein n=1 Tax=Ornithinibacillus halophilus TaxID=930117 RepID=A0A1M5M8T6_9BACI|nr:MFS transporter [Ornithinibacillus halophilus]SHG73615.1 Major Facilitator Superfamily protein [Ornithinibacillus halophilus]